jgi:hypothetical protein
MAIPGKYWDAEEWNNARWGDHYHPIEHYSKKDAGTANIDGDGDDDDSTNGRNNQHTYPAGSKLDELDALSMARHCTFAHT